MRNIISLILRKYKHDYEAGSSLHLSPSYYVYHDKKKTWLWSRKNKLLYLLQYPVLITPAVTITRVFDSTKIW